MTVILRFVLPDSATMSKGRRYSLPSAPNAPPIVGRNRSASIGGVILIVM